MRSRVQRLAAATAAVMVAGAVPGLARLAQADGCVAGAAAVAFTDPADDATQLVVPQPIYSERGLDILAAEVVWDEATQVVTFGIDVNDLSEFPPLGSVGEFFDFNFSISGQAYYVEAYRNHAAARIEFNLGRVEGTSLTDVADLNGVFDAETDRIEIELPSLVTDGAGAPVFQLSDGDTLDAFELNGRRAIGHPDVITYIPVADTAAHPCGVTLANVAPVDGALAVLDAVGESHAFSGAITAGAFGVPGRGLASRACALGCASDVVAVDAPAGATLTVRFTSVTSASDEVTDLDLRLRGPNASHLLTEEPGNGDTITIVDPPAGRYEVEVVPYAAIDAQFDVEISLG